MKTWPTAMHYETASIPGAASVSPAVDVSSELRERVVIYRCRNRRFYRKKERQYVTLKDVFRIVREGVDISIYDVANHSDITASVLAQIVLDKENDSERLMSEVFLRGLIGSYNDEAARILPEFLRVSLETFMRYQKGLTTSLPGATAAIELFERQMKLNMAVFNMALKMLSALAVQSDDVDLPMAERPVVRRR